ncbi:hypothetical protein T484DRAFT_1784355, partial [Baffinella frigidus]
KGGGGLRGLSREIAEEAERCARGGREVVRIVMPSLGGSHSALEGPRSLLCLLHSLKGEVRRQPAVLVFSIPAWLAQSGLGEKMMRLSDCVLRLDSVAAAPSQVRGQFKDYTAFLHLQKPLRLNTLVVFAPKDSVNLLVRIRRKTVLVERMHTAGPPPDLAPTGPSRPPSLDF